MRQQNAARLLHDTRSTIYEATKMLLPAGQGKVNVTESRSRCGGLLIADGVSVEWEIPRTTDHGCVNKSCPPSFRPVEEELMPYATESARRIARCR